ncbi:MAG: glycine--tRNA ligase subunit alpha [Candidatus Midichloria mitochondrii]|uniref:Glycine--tRNA ligase alpha subunit n=1 Tax=Midichloria mitochondrii (strain IricVA) TaxID=696127 RepID=F7XWR9_MIDMI|nr:glycine--tRNA ligase subunit alpha [Candidatus Midichloria mitochondrii]AEI89118.1 glycyl-tRNA synthetase, alpha subunit [Candidatus Midichloria mitochondrii IricVA]MDJ1256982.1 glycine--tRNA ligase subunit alpha [Candidatus Midichloria mitochondrii]MDJ1299552.1 glycine--tRNA ligase subunit alpha [Candidatus Midichloria mitochondrii]MDJ1313645.1 glycine--tRNA ligase subunit alpha [Candidatus Midichloria mitochondrii]MDJ1584223.1 glycine--tRNA ligase subunit alpha [Candidatus Midichloria mit
MHFQDIIFNLQKFWGDKGCVILQPYDIEVGAGTSHPATTLRCLSEEKWNVAYAQPCRRPTDGRYGENPNRMQHYYQFQVLMKPSPDDMQNLVIESLEKVGLYAKNHDIRFVEDDWKNPTLGAWGLGWEIWCDGMEIIQFTYMQQLGGVDCRPVAAEITYGLERLAMFIQKVDSIWDVTWNNAGVTYADIFLKTEKQYSHYNFNRANIEMLKSHFVDVLSEVFILVEVELPQPAYDLCLKASHMFNLLEARGAISVTEREAYIAKIRDAARACSASWLNTVSNLT